MVLNMFLKGHKKLINKKSIISRFTLEFIRYNICSKIIDKLKKEG